MRTLDHLQVDDSRAVERYLLGELSPTEAEEFELHYFECPQCAIAVESGSVFVANARAYLAETAEVPQRAISIQKPQISFAYKLLAYWRQPAFALPLAAAMLFGSVALYQGTIVIPEARQEIDNASVLPLFQLVGASRGDETHVDVPSEAHAFLVSADVPPGQRYLKYVCVLSAGTDKLFRVIAQAPAEGQPITIRVPVKGLRAGTLDLAVFGAGPNGEQAEKVSDWPFDLKFTP